MTVRSRTGRFARFVGGPTPELRPRLRTRLVIAMVFAALVPVVVVALLATRVVLSSLDDGLRDDVDRQLGIGLSLTLRAVERLGDEASQLSESTDLVTALERGPDGLDSWLGRQSEHLPACRVQVFDRDGVQVFAATIGEPHRFANIDAAPDDRVVAGGLSWTRRVSLVASTASSPALMRAVAPIVDEQYTLRGVIVMSTPLDGDFADGLKGALSADVLVGGLDGRLAATFRTDVGTRSAPLILTEDERSRIIGGSRIIRELDNETGAYKLGVTAMVDAREQPVGIIGVAVGREPLAHTKGLALRTLLIGGLIAFAFALALALSLSRRLGAPITQLHRGAIAVSRGDLEHRIEVPGDDELADLATAFNQMTATLKDNQARLAARMREIVALHDAGRAVSSVIDLDLVSRKIVDAVARTFDVELAALWLVEGANEGNVGRLRASAARGRRRDVSSSLATDEARSAAEALSEIAAHVRETRNAIRLVRADADPTFAAAAIRAGAPGPLIALPLERKGRVVGVLAVGRRTDVREFSEADFNLLTTFADQAGAAVENAQLYDEVRAASEELDRKVRLRTAELTAINSELGRALADLRDTQAQLVLSERMAGLGLLVAGVAHEINSPSAAIRGTVDGLGRVVGRVVQHASELAATAGDRLPIIVDRLIAIAPAIAERTLPTSLIARRAARELTAQLTGRVADPQTAAGELADAGASADEVDQLLAAVGEPNPKLAASVVAALTDHVYLHRTTSTVRHAVGQIQRIVGALKSYTHLDQQATRSPADLHEGLETTLTLMHHALRDIVIERRYGELPPVAVYVDELNQVWTNLISNAQQALGASGTITIETAYEPATATAIVRVIDDGPGVPSDALPRIFEPFFTTKPKGEGTGLGLGIARKIVDKHGGQLRCDSQPGRTVFEVRLPVAGGEIAQ